MITISHTTRTYPKLPYEAIAATVLGSRYNLSLVFVGAVRAQQINQGTRGKEYTPNVLSFPLTNQAGEIYLCPTKAKAEAKRYGHNYKTHIAFLFIHGLLHLKGLDHGPEMEKLEQRYLQEYKLTS